MSKIKQSFFPTDLRPNDMIVIQNADEVWLILNVEDANSRKTRITFFNLNFPDRKPIKRIVRNDLQFPVHYKLVRYDSRSDDHGEIKLETRSDDHQIT